MWNLLTTYYYTLFQPEEMSLHLDKITTKNIYFHRFFISFFITSSLILFKDSLKIYDIIFIFILIIFLYFFISLSSSLMGIYITYQLNIFDKITELEKYKQFTENTKNIIEFTWLPFIFLIHFSVISNYFQNKLFFIIGLVVLIFWHFYILFRGIQYHFELNIKKAIYSLLRGFGTLVFLLFFLFLISFILSISFIL